jgi:hypothetical protein
MNGCLTQWQQLCMGIHARDKEKKMPSKYQSIGNAIARDANTSGDDLMRRAGNAASMTDVATAFGFIVGRVFSRGWSTEERGRTNG